MTLRIRLTFFISAIFISLALSLYLIFNTTLMGGFLSLEQQAAKRNVARVKEGINSLQNELAIKAQEWGTWDDSYAFIQKPNANYEKSNLTYEALTQLSLRHFLMIKNDGSVLRNLYVEEDSEKILSAKNSQLDILKSIAAKVLGQDKPTSGLVNLDGKIFIFAAASITNSAGDAPQKGALLFTREFDQSTVTSLKELLKIDLRLQQPHEKLVPNDLNAALNLVQEGQGIGTLAVDGKSYGVCRVLDYSDAPILNLITESPRDLYAQGLQARDTVLTYIFIFTFVAIGCALLFLNGTVITPLRRIGRQSIEIGKLQEDDRRINVSGDREIKSLVLEINRMLEQLSESKRAVMLAKQAADAANSAKSTFLAKISHELRTPLHSILGMLRIVQGGEVNLSRRSYLQMARDSGETLLNTINDLLNFSKASSGMLSVGTVETNVIKIIKETCTAMAPRVYEHTDLEFLCDIEEGIPETIMADPQRLVQVLMNLLGNSVKFTKKGKIEIRATCHDYQEKQWLALLISDSGCGIPKDKISTIFDPFTQAHGTSAKGVQGTGLGLNISKQLIEAMGGTIRVDSTEGQGSTFTILLPCSDGPRRKYQHLPNNRQVCIFSSSEFLNNHLSGAMTKQGFSCSSYSSLESAPDNMRDLNPAQIIIDGSCFAEARIISFLKGMEYAQSKIMILLDPTQLDLHQKLADLKFYRTVWKPSIASDLVDYFDQSDFSKSDNITAELAPQSSSRKLRVLVADDMITNQIILSELLSEAGHTVETVENGLELLNRISDNSLENSGKDPIDIVFTDIQMPELDGLEALQRIRSSEKDRMQSGIEGAEKRLPVIVVTARAMEEECQKIMDLGADAVITKPIQLAQLNVVLAKFAA